MQTFLPYQNFEKSVKCLDYRRLGKQRIESKQILDALLQGPVCNFSNVNTKNGKVRKKAVYGKVDTSLPTIKTPWYYHPITKMWKGYEEALKLYTNFCILEWVARGYNNTMELFDVPKDVKYPWWFGDKKFHESHQSNLLRKDREFYSKFEWQVSDDLPYVWKINEK